MDDRKIQAMFSNDHQIDVKVVDWSGLGDNNPRVARLDEKFKAATEGMYDVSHWTLMLPDMDV